MKTKTIPVPANWKLLGHHALSSHVAFGLGVNLDEMEAGMRNDGFDDSESVIIYEGKILDGRHKHSCAAKTDMVPIFREFIGTPEEAVRFVIRKKLDRQHLDASQKAMFAASLLKLAKQNPAILPDFKSQEKAAESLNISERLVRDAFKVEEHGTPKLQAAVSDGTVSVSDAAKIVAEPAKVQNRAVKDVEQGKAPTATKAVNGYVCKSCERKARVGQPLPKNCPDCKHKDREPGDDTEAEANEKARDKARPKVGAVIWDKKTFEEPYGRLVRAVDQLYKAYGQITEKGAVKADAQHKGLMGLLSEFQVAFTNRQKELSKR